MTGHIYPDFAALVEAEVLPRLLANPDDESLDGGKTTKAQKWKAVGRFMFGGDAWTVHVDNHYEPLLLAYWSVRCRGQDATFRRVPMKRQTKLVLVDDLQALRPPGTVQYMYLYCRSPRRSAA